MAKAMANNFMTKKELDNFLKNEEVRRSAQPAIEPQNLKGMDSALKRVLDSPQISINSEWGTRAGYAGLGFHGSRGAGPLSAGRRDKEILSHRPFRAFTGITPIDGMSQRSKKLLLLGD